MIAPAATCPAPAKLNLGLEILRRRPDGYHDIATVTRTIDLADVVTVEWTEAPGVSLVVEGFPIPSGSDGPVPNLVTLAAGAMLAARPLAHGLHIRLEKAIPPATGLGGASSDAAATMRAINALLDDPLDDETLRQMALSIGSDVPLFLTGGTALVTGRGDAVAPIPVRDGGATYLVVCPDLSEPLDRKTATLYAALRPDDFSDGGRVFALATALRVGQRPNPELYSNAFRRPLLDRWPDLLTIEEALRRDADAVAFSGAGPSLYGVYPDRHSAEMAQARVRERASPSLVVVAAPVGLPTVTFPRRGNVDDAPERKPGGAPGRFQGGSGNRSHDRMPPRGSAGVGPGC